MRVLLDGQDLFDEEALEIAAGSIRRQTIEKAAAGLDGGVRLE